MAILELSQQSRSYRRFHQERPVERELLEQLVGLVPHCPSARNMQPLKFVLSHTVNRNALIFPTLVWAGYLRAWPGPAEGERPSAYIVMLEDLQLSRSSEVDQGIAAQTIMLGAAERGLGGCMVAAFKREHLVQVLQLPSHLRPVLVLALGYPSEQVRIVPMPADGCVEYYRDEHGVHYVPKRSLAELLVD
ncbi:MAG: nitroreductase family protein [Bacteroidales bacterium]|nr:nitroreductase family protein [Bacteroidales bacterium]